MPTTYRWNHYGPVCGTKWKRAAYQEVIEVNPEKIEPNPGEKEAAVEQQENPNKEAAIHSLMACRKERRACEESTKANPEKMEKINGVIAALE
jgi:hypothetical protein